MKAFTQEWADQFKNKLNSNAAYREASATWEWPLALTMTEVTAEHSVLLDLYHGECRDAKVIPVEELERAEYVISADKETWQKIFLKELSPLPAIMMKKLVLRKGVLANLVQYVDSAKELVNTATEIETEF